MAHLQSKGITSLADFAWAVAIRENLTRLLSCMGLSTIYQILRKCRPRSPSLRRFMDAGSLPRQAMIVFRHRCRLCHRSLTLQSPLHHCFTILLSYVLDLLHLAQR